MLYAVGARLDEQPQSLFLLRHVDHNELVSQAASAENLSGALGESGETLAGEDLGAMFGIDLDSASLGQLEQRVDQRSHFRRDRGASRRLQVIEDRETQADAAPAQQRIAKARSGSGLGVGVTTMMGMLPKTKPS